ncbi:MAG: hypothetical protein ABIK31_01620 [candidate division WOR-3 bacterium]
MSNSLSGLNPEHQDYDLSMLIDDGHKRVDMKASGYSTPELSVHVDNSDSVSTSASVGKLSYDVSGNLEDEIKKLKEENSGYIYQNLRNNQESVDKYKLGGKMTYYYQNISKFALTFGTITDVVNFPLAPGDIVDFRDYFQTEEEILKNLEIKKYERPLIGPPYLRRLTPEEYANKLRIKRELLAKRRDEERLRSSANDAKTTVQEKVSSVVESNVRQLLTYFKTPAEERYKLTYTPTHFQSWLLGAIFTEAEYNWMMVNIKDYEVQKKIIERKQELDVLNQQYNILSSI